MLKFSILTAVLGGLVMTTGAATAATTKVVVSGMSGPWLQSLNAGLGYGVHDNGAPTVVSLGFNFAAGGSFTIKYISGLTNPFGGAPSYDAIGEMGYIANNGPGSSRTGFPSGYIPISTYPVYLSELVGAFADNGVVAGTPFVVGDLATIMAPSGANQLLLGVNDDIFVDNSGSLNVEVSGPSAAVSAVPLPASLPMFASAILALAGFGYCMNRWVAPKGRPTTSA